MVGAVTVGVSLLEPLPLLPELLPEPLLPELPEPELPPLPFEPTADPARPVNWKIETILAMVFRFLIG